jgi:diguanylate cyclase with GGDEF domain
MTQPTAPGPPRPQRPEPIGWGIAEALADDAQAVAKGWLLALLERLPLERAGTIPAAELAAEAPAICAALSRALGSDRELARLAPGGDLAALAARVPALAGAADAAAAAAAVEALRACLAVAAHDAQSAAGPPAPEQLAERLALVAATVTETALGAGSHGSAAATDEPAAAPAASPAGGPRAADAPPGTGAETAPAAPASSPAGGPRAADALPGAGAETAPAAPLAADAPPDLAPPFGNGSVTHLPTRSDARHGPAASMDDSELWIASLERHLDRCQREGGGLALLRVELVDAERLVASAPEAEKGVPYGRLAQAIRRAIRRQDLVASDHHGRAWVIAPAVGRAGAIALAERIAAGVERGEHWRGAPLAATIGFAVYGEDGQDAETLIERAEEAMLAASAAGVRIGEAIPGDPPRTPPRPVG